LSAVAAAAATVAPPAVPFESSSTNGPIAPASTSAWLPLRCRASACAALAAARGSVSAVAPAASLALFRQCTTLGTPPAAQKAAAPSAPAAKPPMRAAIARQHASRKEADDRACMRTCASRCGAPVSTSAWRGGSPTARFATARAACSATRSDFPASNRLREPAAPPETRAVRSSASSASIPQAPAATRCTRGSVWPRRANSVRVPPSRCTAALFCELMMSFHSASVAASSTAASGDESSDKRNSTSVLEA